VSSWHELDELVRTPVTNNFLESRLALLTKLAEIVLSVQTPKMTLRLIAVA